MKIKKPRRRKSANDNDAQAIAQAVKFCQTCRRSFLTNTRGLSPIRRRILDIVERHGEVMPEVLHAAVYGSDPNGGASMKTLHVHIFQLNKLLAPYGMAVRAGSGRGQPYRMIAEAAE